MQLQETLHSKTFLCSNLSLFGNPFYEQVKQTDLLNQIANFYQPGNQIVNTHI